VRKSGEVDCWGVDSRGAVGRPAGTWVAHQVTRPSRVEGIDDAVEVSCGEDHSCVRRRTGTVSCFGVMDTAPDAPQMLRPIDGLRDVTALASGGHFVCGLTRVGEVWCAGYNSLAELGGGDHDPHAAAVRVRGLSHVAQITASGVHACARTEAGEVWCWGSEFGHGIMAARTDDMDKGPVRITGLGKAVDLSVGEREACATLDDGSLWCWGQVPAVQRGQALPVQRTIP
jgi:alpha-tubulin suppressor-like RCC1 family protein